MDRKADPQTQLLVDEAILDYFMYTASKAMLKSPKDTVAAEGHAHLPLQMVGSFLPTFQCLHPDHTATAEIRFRVRLLRFAYVFKQRRWYLNAPRCSSTVDPWPKRHDDNGRKQIPRAFLQEQQEQVSLRETLPFFLALSAVQNALQESTITELWMRLAAGYIAQAYAEQVLAYENSHSSLLEEIFEWGCDSRCTAEEGSDEWRINEMFHADDDVVTLWEHIKEEHMRALRPPDGISLRTHLESIVSGSLSTSTFKEKVTEFLMGLLCAHPKPLLTQIESGKVNGLSREATAALKKRAGFV